MLDLHQGTHSISDNDFFFARILACLSHPEKELNALLNGHGVSDDDADILKELRQIQEEHALEVDETIPKVPDHDLPEAEKVVDSSKESSKESMEKPKENSKAKSKEAAEKKAKTEKAIQKAREAVPA